MSAHGVFLWVVFKIVFEHIVNCHFAILTAATSAVVAYIRIYIYGLYLMFDYRVHIR